MSDDPSSTVYRHDRAVRLEQVDEQLVLSGENRPVIVLEGTAVALWNLVDGQRTAGSIIRECSLRYAGDEETISADVLETLSYWLDARLIESTRVSGAGDAPG